MNLAEIETRAAALLAAIDAPKSTKAASGRYLRSSPIRRGIRYWATTQGRYERDLIGVQFFGQGVAEGEKLGKILERAGFLARTPQKSQLTYAKPVEYRPDGRIDETAVRRVRRQIDDLLDTDVARETPGRTSFRAFMVKSPLADVELILPDRDGGWRKEVN